MKIGDEKCDHMVSETFFSSPVFINHMVVPVG
jgi:hypothetical protein